MAFFSDLKTLKIQLEEHSAIDLLRNLHPNLCQQIEELWLDAKYDDSDDQQLEHEVDVTDILSKFVNLTSLELVTTSIDFDAKRLFSICSKLNHLSIRRRRQNNYLL